MLHVNTVDLFVFLRGAIRRALPLLPLLTHRASSHSNIFPWCSASNRHPEEAFHNHRNHSWLTVGMPEISIYFFISLFKCVYLFRNKMASLGVKSSWCYDGRSDCVTDVMSALFISLHLTEGAETATSLMVVTASAKAAFISSTCQRRGNVSNLNAQWLLSGQVHLRQACPMWKARCTVDSLLFVFTKQSDEARPLPGCNWFSCTRWHVR